MKLESFHEAAEKKRWRVIRLDNFSQIPGDIVTADEVTGECQMNHNGETKTHNFGPGGIKLIGVS